MKKALLIAACALAALLAPASAQGEITFLSSFGSLGGTAGKLSNPAGLAVNNANSNIYVANRGNNRVEQFTAAGAFVRAWGYDVVASGTDNKPFANEVDEVAIRATNGSFSLAFKGAETGQLPFNATAAEVQGALNGLSTISASGGSVTVSGGPGDETASQPYVVTFSGGPLAATNLELGIEPSGLGVPGGTALSCEGFPNFSFDLEEGLAALPVFVYQWLANGVPISGATSATFTPGVAEEGKAIQCQVTGTIAAVKTMAVSRPYSIASPAPAPLPPLGPAAIAAPEGKALVGADSGSLLTCKAGSWTRNAEGFTYQWYRNGSPIGTPTTTPSTTNVYELTAGDLFSKAVFQCGVTGHNAGGSSTAISKFLPTEPEQTLPHVANVTVEVSAASSGTSKIITRTNGGAVLEVCKANPPSTDVCKEGVAGSGFGQFNEPRSIAVDNSPSGGGAVYVMDDGNPRMQKFTAEGVPILAVGKGVDQTTNGNVCTAASGHACGGGLLDKRSMPGSDNSTPGAFGGISPQNGSSEVVLNGFTELGNELAVDSAGNLYAGDPRRKQDYTPPRIEKFDSSGVFQSQVRFAGAAGTANARPISVAADSSERAYGSTNEGSQVERFSPFEFSATGDETVRSGNVVDDEGSPVQLAVDIRSDRLLVSDKNTFKTRCGPTPVAGRAIIEYDSALHEIDCSVPVGSGALPQATGMAVVPLLNRLYVAVGSQNLIKIFKLPTPVAPVISAESSSDITTESALLHGTINPGFEDTIYKFEFGLEDCSSHPCSTVGGGTLYGLKFVDGTAQISGLEPATTYHYRVVAENALGTVTGPDRTFTTFPLVDLVTDPCPNALARKQTKTVALLDCRAYELVSASFTAGYDVESNLVPGQAPFDQHPAALGKLLYGVHNGGIPGTGNPTNRGVDPYVSTRGEDGRWTTKYLGIPANNPYATEPFSSTLIGADSGLDTLAFGGSEICDHCFADGSSGLPVRLPNGELVQGMTGSSPDPTAEAAGYVAKPLSADGSHLVFGTDSKLEPTANEGGEPTIYARDLALNATEVVSTDETGATLSGDVGELAVSTDGSRVLIGAKVSTDGHGNAYWNLYLHSAGDPESVDLTPATSSGVLFDGMTPDGGETFFTTKDQLLPSDTDESADIYEAEIDSEGHSSLRLVSVSSDGSPSNSDSCSPSNEPNSWNWPVGDGKCSALAFAGGAGLATNGTFFFLSPEQLEDAEGTANQPNLYLVEPGGDPRFVATIDTSVGKPGPAEPNRPLVNSNFGGGGFASPQALAVDQATNDVYALDAGAGKLYRYESSGAPHAFTAGSHEGNALTGFTALGPSAAEVAVDNSAGFLSSDIYVADASGVRVFAQSGEQLGALDGSAANKGKWTFNACGVAVDQSSGTVYVGDLRGYVWQYAPTSPAGAITDADYTVKGMKPKGMQPCSVAADSAGRVYAAQATDGPVQRFAAASFVAGNPPTVEGSEIDEAGKALAVDPATNELYVDEGDQISVFDTSGDQVRTIGAGKLACGELGSRGVSVNKTSHHVYASCFVTGSIKEFGYEVPPFTPVDNPAILHAANRVEAHSYGDFQVTPDGRFAAFATSMPLQAGYDNASHLEVYLYGSQADELTCVSCASTEAQAATDSTLPPNGLGVLEDGRVFFNSGDQLTLRDTNEKLDAYEWEDGVQQLISAGTSAYPSGMLGVSADGTDAFFFTRDTLVGEDENGPTMKVYDAREDGGRFVLPPSPPCAAADECHGPGTQAAPQPQVGTLNGSGGQFEEARSVPKVCKKPKVRRKGRCVKPRRKARHKHAAQRGGHR